MGGKLFAASVAVLLVVTPLSAQQAKPLQNTNQDNGAAHTDAPAQASPQSTESAGPIVTDNNQASARSTNRKHDGLVDGLWSDLKITDILLSFFTGALAVYTFLLWRSTEKLWSSAKEQLRESANATSAMNASNEITRKAYVSEHRPWLSVSDPQFESDIIIETNTLTSTISVLVTNIGKSPAYDVITFMQPHEVHPDDKVKRLETRAEAVRRQSNSTISKIVLPGEQYRRRFGITFDSMSGRGIAFIPSIIGSTVYRSSISEEIHYTDFEFTAGAPQFEGGNSRYRPFDATKKYDYREAVWEPGTSSGVA